MAAAEEVGRQMIGGRNAQTMGSVKAGIKVDVSRISSVSMAFKDLLKQLKDVRSELTSIGKLSGKALPGSGPTSSGYLPAAVNTSPPRSGGSFLPGILGGGGKGGAGGGGGGGIGTPGSTTGYLSGSGWGAAAVGIGQAVGSAVGAVDNRINGNMGYALPADRLSVVQQQMTGLSQNQVANQYRKPLANYRLGQGGINSLLTNQTRYGIDAGKQAAGYEALRTVSGFSLSTQDLVGIQNQLTSPQVANRLFNMTGGFNFNQAGGGSADLFKSFQKLSKLQGLDNPNILKGAFQQGSFTRANLSNLGLDSTTQDLLLQYAQQNQTFKKKGGKGDYDPSKKEDTKLMGVENNYATQNEETDRVKTMRDENMYRRQADNYAALEKSNQSLIKALGSLEDKLSGLIGARASTRPWQKALGGVLGIAGGIGMFINPVVGAGLLGASAAVNGAGDPMPQAGGVKAASVGGSASDANDSNISVPIGYGNQRASLAALKTRADFKSMKPAMQDRLLRMFRENPNVGIGQGFRSSADQENMFRSRYRPTNKNTGITWMGQNWEHVSGAPAAPPGKSMHEIGLAADLVGDTNWVSANASRFGLKNFANVNGEKWHVQPSELPNSRTEYEKSSGKPVDTSSTFGAADAARTGTGTSSGGSDTSSAASITSSGPNAYTGFSIQDVLNQVLGQRPVGNGGSSSVRASKPSNGANPTATTTGGTPASIAPAGTLAGAQVAQYAWNAGFRGQDLVNIVAIAKRESSWKPTVFNGNKKTGDESYGLTQINMLGSMGPARRKQFGITSNDQLFDPQTNMNAAFKLYSSSGNKLTAWGGYKGKSNTFNTNTAAAQQAVTDAHLGDPMPQGPVDFGSRGPAPRMNSMPSNVQVHSSPQISMPVKFEFNGVPSTIDMKDIASKLMAMIKTEAELEGMRIS